LAHGPVGVVQCGAQRLQGRAAAAPAQRQRGLAAHARRGIVQTLGQRLGRRSVTQEPQRFRPTRPDRFVGMFQPRDALGRLPMKRIKVRSRRLVARRRRRFRRTGWPQNRPHQQESFGEYQGRRKTTYRSRHRGWHVLARFLEGCMGSGMLYWVGFVFAWFSTLRTCRLRNVKADAERKRCQATALQRVTGERVVNVSCLG
jgi:hypothetical protein